MKFRRNFDLKDFWIDRIWWKNRSMKENRIEKSISTEYDMTPNDRDESSLLAFEFARDREIVECRR